MGSLTMEQIRRRILVNATPPHLETASGTVASFTTDVSAPLNSCLVNFSYVQTGSGDPSPENIRPINGWNGLIMYNNDSPVLNVSWTGEAGTIYGGYVDLVSGVLTATMWGATKKISEYYLKSEKNDGTTRYDYVYDDAVSVKTNSKLKSNISIFKWALNDGTTHFYIYTNAGSPRCISHFQTGIDETLDFTVIAELSTPITYQITPQTISALRGNNAIRSNAGETVTVEYWTH